jgi:hypothetical protein
MWLTTWHKNFTAIGAFMSTPRVRQGNAGISASSFPNQPKRRFGVVVQRTTFAIFIAVSAYVWNSLPAHATVTAVSMQAPALAGATSNVTSPIHFQATAESDATITGYVVYIDSQIAYQNFLRVLDAWVVVAPGNHSLYVKAWDSDGSLLSTPTYEISITSFVSPNPPLGATRELGVAGGASSWTVDNSPGVGGECNDGSIGTFESLSDPNTSNSPDYPRTGQMFMVTSKCQYDDSLFYRKNTQNPSPFAADTNFLWDFWFYIPTTTQAASIQALEFDLFQAVQLSDGVHEFMFGSQCNYATNQWQNWLPHGSGLTWVNVGLSPCQFSTGAWHHATYFLQRVTPGGYQEIPASFDPSSDANTSVRFGTLTIDGNTMYLGGLANSTIPSPAWSPALGVQHQLDSAQAGVTIAEYDDNESLTTW